MRVQAGRESSVSETNMTDASDILVERLLAWGVDTVFGLPGDGINGVFEALRKQKDRIRFIHVRHEEAAAFMACAYAKFTGRLGVCIATSGPGGIHLLNGLYDAKMDHAPVLAITGMQHSDLIGTFTQQDVALDKLFIDVAVYNERIMSGAHMESVTDLAIRIGIGFSWRSAHYDSGGRTGPGDQKGTVRAQPNPPYFGGPGLLRSTAGTDRTGACCGYSEPRKEDCDSGWSRRVARDART